MVCFMTSYQRVTISKISILFQFTDFLSRNLATDDQVWRQIVHINWFECSLIICYSVFVEVEYILNTGYATKLVVGNKEFKLPVALAKYLMKMNEKYSLLIHIWLLYVAILKCLYFLV